MKKLFNVLKSFTDPRSPKVELGYVFYDTNNKKLVSTNAIQLIIVEYNLESETNLLIDVNNKGIGIDPIVVGSQIAYKENSIGHFPKYENIIVRDSKLTEPITSNLSFAECILNVGSFIREKIIVKYNKNYGKLNLYQENTRIHYNDCNEPFMVSGLVDYGNRIEKKMLSTKIIIMPKDIR